MSHARWRNGFHLSPPAGWLNDPNGLCQLRGTYHVFHQYSPDWPAPGAARGWGHFTSTDLTHWRHHGMAVRPDTPEEASGSYSGSAVVVPGAAADGGDALRLYYTGNVKEPGSYDYVRAGRQANQILIACEPDAAAPGGLALGEKNVLLRNADYPDFCTCHVRDPKVWREGGAWWMLLGARDLDDRGCALVLRSDDGLAWEAARTLRATTPFGFMWECPDRLALGGREWLSVCPQGMEGRPWSHGLRDQAVYLPLPAGEKIGEPGDLMLDEAGARLWDAGFDFYAPQTFVDEGGRTLLIGWMGLPEAPWESAPDGLDWCHCLTVPREVTAGAGGALLQRPARELEALRGAEVALDADGCATLPEGRADLVVTGAEGGVEVLLDGGAHVALEDGTLRVEFLDEAVGAGRDARETACPGADDLRVLVDGSSIEVFAGGGRAVMATRWFPRGEALSVRVRGAGKKHLWEMGDGMA